MEDFRMAQFYDRLQALRFASGEVRKLRDLFAEFCFRSLPEEMQKERRAADPAHTLPLNQPGIVGAEQVDPGAAVPMMQPGQAIHISKNVQIMAPPPGVGGPIAAPQRLAQVAFPKGAVGTQARAGAIMDGRTLLQGTVRTSGGQTVSVRPGPGTQAQIAAIAIAEGEPVPDPKPKAPLVQTPPGTLPPTSRKVAGPTIHNPEASGANQGDGDDTKKLEELNLKDLRELATAHEIDGRSSMSREELVEAIADAQTDDDDDDKNGDGDE